MRFQKSQFIHFFGKSPLRDRFILSFVFLAAVPVLILGSVSIYLIDLSHRNDVSQLELQMIEREKKSIEKFLADTAGIIRLRVGTIQDTSEPQPILLDNQLFLLEGLMEENSAFEEVSFVDVGGLISNDIPTVDGRVTAKAVRVRDESGRTSIHLAEASEQEALIISQLPRYAEPAQGRNFIGDAYYTLDGAAITIAAPVLDKNNHIIHVLVAEVSLQQVTRSIEQAGVGSRGYAFLLDRRGRLLAHGAPVSIRQGTSFFGRERVIQVLAGEALDGLGDHDRYGSYFNEEPVVGAGKRIPGVDWALFIEWPIEDSDALIGNIRTQVLQLTLFTILAVVIIAFFFATRLVRPIRQLEQAVRAIERGNFKQQVSITTGDELEELGNAFNRMTKGLKRLQELRDEFVFVAAHELRSPVTVIKGYVSMVLEGDAGKISSEVRDFLTKAQTANERLLKLVFDLLEVARSEAGRITIQVKPLELQTSVQSSVDELQPLADEKSIKLNYKKYAKLPLVMADSDRVKEVMINLAGNAIKYTQKGGWVRISHEVKGNTVVTHIQDNGFGMSPEAQKKLFTKFYRVQTEKTHEITGTGLGLFIVKELITKMKGRIWVQSEEGKGSTFSFTLPITKATPQKIAQGEEKEV